MSGGVQCWLLPESESISEMAISTVAIVASETNGKNAYMRLLWAPVNLANTLKVEDRVSGGGAERGSVLLSHRGRER